MQARNVRAEERRAGRGAGRGQAGRSGGRALGFARYCYVGEVQGAEFRLLLTGTCVCSSPHLSVVFVVLVRVRTRPRPGPPPRHQRRLLGGWCRLGRRRPGALGPLLLQLGLTPPPAASKAGTAHAGQGGAGLCVRVCMCVRARVRACVRACVRVCFRGPVCRRASPSSSRAASSCPRAP